MRSTRTTVAAATPRNTWRPEPSPGSMAPPAANVHIGRCRGTTRRRHSMPTGALRRRPPSPEWRTTAAYCEGGNRLHGKPVRARRPSKLEERAAPARMRGRMSRPQSVRSRRPAIRSRRARPHQGWRPSLRHRQACAPRQQSRWRPKRSLGTGRTRPHQAVRFADGRIPSRCTA